MNGEPNDTWKSTMDVLSRREPLDDDHDHIQALNCLKKQWMCWMIVTNSASFDMVVFPQEIMWVYGCVMGH